MEMVKLRLEAVAELPGRAWAWLFTAEDGRIFGWRTPLGDVALLRETFDAFGEDADTDTGDLIGRPVLAVVSDCGHSIRWLRPEADRSQTYEEEWSW